MKTLVVATHNRGKVKEIEAILSFMDLEILSLQDFDNVPVIVEDGSSFRENARKKAEIIARFSGEVTLADDSGLEVDALGGRPGVFSARFDGENADDVANNIKLLKELQGVPLFNRTARFCCAVAVAIPSGETEIAEGYCNGLIAEKPRGVGGFGYDPLFIVPAYDKTFAELPLEVKNEISHRGKALARAVIILEKILGRSLG